jgi:hypothetical protein
VSALNAVGVPAGYFDGGIDEVRIWSVARTQTEIQGSKNQYLSAPTPGLVGRWAFDEGAGTLAYGTAGTGIHGSIVGTAVNNWSRIACGSGAVAVGDEPVTELALKPVMPNPAGDHARFAFALPRSGHVKLEIIDVQGRRVAMLANREFSGGHHDVTWNRQAAGVPVRGGVYFVHFSGLGRTITRKFVVAQ